MYILAGTSELTKVDGSYFWLVDHREVSEQQQFHEIESKWKNYRGLSIQHFLYSKILSNLGHFVSLRRKVYFIVLLKAFMLIFKYRLKSSQFKRRWTQKVAVVYSKFVWLAVFRIDLLPQQLNDLDLLVEDHNGFLFCERSPFVHSFGDFLLQIMRGVLEQKKMQTDIWT